jgi:hypothetical protein
MLACTGINEGKCGKEHTHAEFYGTPLFPHAYIYVAAVCACFKMRYSRWCNKTLSCAFNHGYTFRPDGGSQLELIHVAVNKLIIIGVVCDLIHILLFRFTLLVFYLSFNGYF